MSCSFSVLAHHVAVPRWWMMSCLSKTIVASYTVHHSCRNRWWQQPLCGMWLFHRLYHDSDSIFLFPGSEADSECIFCDSPPGIDHGGEPRPPRNHTPRRFARAGSPIFARKNRDPCADPGGLESRFENHRDIVDDQRHLQEHRAREAVELQGRVEG